MRISDWSSDVCSSDLRALARRPRDRPEFIRHQRIAADHSGGKTLLAHLAHDETGLGLVATEIEHVGLGLLQLGNERAVVFFAGGVGFMQNLLNAARL